MTDIVARGMSDNGGLSDDLRTRIAAAITAIRIQRDGDAYFMADAVIRELGLTRQDNEADFGGPYWHRYVTDWLSDHE